MNKKRLTALAAITCAFTCALWVAACDMGRGEQVNPDIQQNPNYSQTKTDFEYELTEDGSGYLVTGMGDTTDTNITIPETYNDLPVIGIAKYAFLAREDLTGVSLGDNIEYIGENAFTYCSGLTSIRIPVSVKEIGEGAFTNCSNLRGILFAEGSSLTEIGYGTFWNCTSLAAITIPDSVTNIGTNAFRECANLRTVILGNGVKTIDNSAFRRCYSLKELVLPATLTNIGKQAFYNSNIEAIYWGGTQDQWNRVSKGEDNEVLTGVKKYFYSETAPTTRGDYWHYVDGKPVAW